MPSEVRLWFLISIPFEDGALNFLVRPSNADPFELDGFTMVMNLLE